MNASDFHNCSPEDPPGYIKFADAAKLADTYYGKEKEAKDLLVEVLMQTQETHSPGMEAVIKKIRAYLERDRNERLADTPPKDEGGETKTGSGPKD